MSAANPLFVIPSIRPADAGYDRVTTVEMESTGVYWIAPYKILEKAGIDVCLANSRQVKHVPGRKSDVSDCQWLQYLHSVGLLCDSFRPDSAVCALRSLNCRKIAAKVGFTGCGKPESLKGHGW